MMKLLQKYLLFCALSTFALTANGTPQGQPLADSITLSIAIKGGPDLPVNISTPVNGSFFIGQWEKAKTNHLGKIQTRLPLDTAGYCQIWLNYLPWVGRSNCIQLFVEPGGHYAVFLEKDKEFESVAFEGDHVSENELLNSFNRYRIDYWGESEYLKSITPSSPEKSILGVLNDLKASDLKLVQQLQQQQAYSNTFVKVLKEDIHYYYAHLFYVAWDVKHLAAKTDADSLELAVWDNDLKTVMEHSPIDNTVALGSYWYNNYKDIIWPRYFDEAVEKLKNIPKDSSHLLTYELITNHFSKDVREQHLAYAIRANAIKNKFSKTVQQQYRRFSKDFPFSPFLPELNEEFKGVLELTNLSKDQRDVLNQSSISNLTELIQLYPNQVLYVDVWASWCGPCKQEFASEREEVSAFMKANGIKQVFITIDDSSKSEMCKEIIAYYNLKGDHYLANHELNKSIEEELNDGDKMPIPRYFIVNKQGAIAVKNAERPSSEDRLIAQLKKVIE